MDQHNRPEPPHAAPPKEMIEAFLDYLRATMVAKLAGLDEEQGRRKLVPSVTNLLGMVQHLAYVERWWFQMVFAREDRPVLWTDEDPDADWRVAPELSVAEVIALYEAECARSREIVAAASLEDRPAREGKEQTLAWILVHMVEETARHCGHADILRELIDGQTGE